MPRLETRVVVMIGEMDETSNATSGCIINRIIAVEIMDSRRDELPRGSLFIPCVSATVTARSSG